MIRRESDFENLVQKVYQKTIPRFKIADIDSVLDFGKMLGRGRFGVVIIAKGKSSGKEYAVKVISKRHASICGEETSARVKLAEREITILRMVNHPHIVRLDEVYDTDQKIYMAFELCTGELAKVFREKKCFTEVEARHVLADLASAVSYLHKKEIVHRDLKLENILVTINPEDTSDNLYIKVIDFGLSTVKGGVGYEDMLQDFCGTVVYMAPELIGEKLYSQQCDVWAMGVILYLLLSGAYPFYSCNEQTLYDLILENEPSFTEQAWKASISREAVHLTAKMLTKNPAFRITAREVGNHPWILNKKMSDINTANILEMMQQWRDDMNKDDESNWIEYEGTKSREILSIVPKTPSTGSIAGRTGATVIPLDSAGSEAIEAYVKKMSESRRGGSTEVREFGTNDKRQRKSSTLQYLKENLEKKLYDMKIDTTKRKTSSVLSSGQQSRRRSSESDSADDSVSSQARRRKKKYGRNSNSSSDSAGTQGRRSSSEQEDEKREEASKLVSTAATTTTLETTSVEPAEARYDDTCTTVPSEARHKEDVEKAKSVNKNVHGSAVATKNKGKHKDARQKNPSKTLDADSKSGSSGQCIMKKKSRKKN